MISAEILTTPFSSILLVYVYITGATADTATYFRIALNPFYARRMPIFWNWFVIFTSIRCESDWLFGKEFKEPQFKNAIMTLATEAAVLTADDPEQAIEIFQSILQEIYRVKYYRPKRPRPSQPRVTKRSLNLCVFKKIKNLANA